jgi:hypothetical protein
MGELHVGESRRQIGGGLPAKAILRRHDEAAVVPFFL